MIQEHLREFVTFPAGDPCIQGLSAPRKGLSEIFNGVAGHEDETSRRKEVQNSYVVKFLCINIKRNAVCGLRCHCFVAWL